MPFKARNVLLYGLGAAAALGLGWLALRSDPVPVDLHELTRAPMQVTVNADARTRIAEIYEVAAPIAGIARRSPVREGDPVIADETVVAIVEPAAPGLLDMRSRIQAEAAVREAEAALVSARSSLRQAEEELTYARTDHERTRTLVERGVASITRLEDAEQRLRTAEAGADAAASNLERANGALDRVRAALIEPGDDAGQSSSCCVRLHAPVDGRVLSIDTISERPVAAGTRLLSVGRPEDLEIVADLLSTDAVRLAPGARAVVERWGGAGTLAAELTKVEPSGYTKVSALGIEEQRVDVVFDLVTPVADRAGLGDGFSVFLRIVEWEADDILQVPLGAIFRRGQDWAVFVADKDDTARLQVIELGRRNETAAQVLSGLEAGQRVITHPSDAIRDGIRIVARDGGQGA
ncbi:HlyD family efflux transporter periplasmic adaptor subunit [Marivita sp.]|uniref:efflux RND transporter periplasmic adaptor subunit n=1 Tax=Marivita sp. TaxID=2003365 RepID=UPI0025B7C549|nr:HlyD family efflux transporter periplasmic adaptor subunit [Marivita sp.]HKL55243.1 HlyD family efflux transporter periplasmic adaptor subunit [Roseovarius sp.]